jgi:hypothetical protein
MRELLGPQRNDGIDPERAMCGDKAREAGESRSRSPPASDSRISNSTAVSGWEGSCDLFILYRYKLNYRRSLVKPDTQVGHERRELSGRSPDLPDPEIEPASQERPQVRCFALQRRRRSNP